MLLLQVIFICHMSVIKNLFLITVSPQLGWDEINKSGQTTRMVLRGGVLPMLVALAIASFIPFLYDSEEWTLIHCVIHAIAELSSFVASLYITSFVLGGLYGELSKSHSSTIRMNNYIAYCLMFLIFVEILSNMMAYLFPPVLFLILYLPVIASKGVEYLGVTNEKRATKVVLVSSALMVAIPYIIRTLLELIIYTGA